MRVDECELMVAPKQNLSYVSWLFKRLAMLVGLDICCRVRMFARKQNLCLSVEVLAAAGSWGTLGSWSICDKV